ncbi:MAG TPA: hypothetical protein VMB79_15945 [Jatrophihabitans sp.]|nr:hypothetical protein [Jatrophihabitans sp.]
MSPSTAVATRSRTWTPLLAGLRSESMDCLQVNLAALADQAYGPGSHLALGAWLRLPLVAGPDSLLEASVPLAERLAEAGHLLGLAVAERQDGTTGDALVRSAGAAAPAYVVADAHAMGWLPMAGKQHLQHSFLLVGAGSDCLVADGYHNSTPWGDARPGVWRVPSAELAAAATPATVLRFTPLGLPALPIEQVAVGNAAALAGTLPLIPDYLAGLREHRTEQGVIDRIVLDSWLLGRGRDLHARWLDSALPGSPVAAAALARAEAWAGFTLQTFVAARRTQRGTPLADSLFDDLAALLLGDAEFARESAEPLVHQVLVEELSALLPGDGRLALAGDPAEVVLRELPNFSSFRLVDLIGRTEDRLAVQLDPDRLAGDSLRTLAGLQELFLPVRREVLMS